MPQALTWSAFVLASGHDKGVPRALAKVRRPRQSTNGESYRRPILPQVIAANVESSSISLSQLRLRRKIAKSASTSKAGRANYGGWGPLIFPIPFVKSNLIRNGHKGDALEDGAAIHKLQGKAQSDFQLGPVVWSRRNQNRIWCQPHTIY